MSSNIKIFSISLAVFLILLIIRAYHSYPDNIKQPISYNHKIHIEAAELSCIDCHIYYEEYASASIPNIEICGECHSDEPISNSYEEVKLLEFINDERLIHWRQIYNVPDHVYFSHRRHVVLGEIECNECHGNVAELITPIDKQDFEMTMDFCMDCHKEHNVTNDCLTCHL